MPRISQTSVTTLRTLDDLHPDPMNANRGTERGRVALRTSLTRYGAARSIVVDKRGRIIGGHKTVEAAKAMGLPITVVPTSGDHLVVVQRLDLDVATDNRARALGIADNQVAHLGLEWDSDKFQALINLGLDLDKSLFTDEEFALILGANSRKGPTDENAVLAPPEKTDIARGDLFRLGRHRLLCGDATDSRDVTRLLNGARPTVMATDPPYGIRYAPEWRHTVDPRQRTAVERVLNDGQADWSAAYSLFPGDVLYTWHAGLHAGVVATAIQRAGFTLRSQIIWYKQHFALSRGDFHWSHEPCWYAIRHGRSSHWRGDRCQTTVWEVPNLNPMGGVRDGENVPTGHSTQKPVRLFELPLLNHTTVGDAIYDPFVGSGTALIAAEKMGRVCYAMDLDPRYVQVAVTRWEQFTGQRATRVRGRRTTGRRS
jgi:DNA modification methylase